MKYYREVNFIDQEWLRIVELLSESKQLKNTIGCLILLTSIDNRLSNTSDMYDEHISGLQCLRSIKRYLQDCPFQETRCQCINVIIVSVLDGDNKESLLHAWKAFAEMYYEQPVQSLLQVSSLVSNDQ